MPEEKPFYATIEVVQAPIESIEQKLDRIIALLKKIAGEDQLDFRRLATETMEGLQAREARRLKSVSENTPSE